MQLLKRLEFRGLGLYGNAWVPSRRFFVRARDDSLWISKPLGLGERIGRGFRTSHANFSIETGTLQVFGYAQDLSLFLPAG